MEFPPYKFEVRFADNLRAEFLVKNDWQELLREDLAKGLTPEAAYPLRTALTTLTRFEVEGFAKELLHLGYTTATVEDTDDWSPFMYQLRLSGGRKAGRPKTLAVATIFLHLLASMLQQGGLKLVNAPPEWADTY